MKRIGSDKSECEFVWSAESGEFVTPCYCLKLTDEGIAYINDKNGHRIFDNKNGLAVLNRGCMGLAVHGNRLSIPLLYSNDYLCGTRILDGIYEDEFALLPFDSSLSDADLYRKAMSYAYPPVVSVADKGNGDLSELSFANFKADGGEVTAETDLIGNEIAKVNDGKLSFRPWEIKTVL